MPVPFILGIYSPSVGLSSRFWVFRLTRPARKPASLCGNLVGDNDRFLGLPDIVNSDNSCSPDNGQCDGCKRTLQSFRGRKIKMGANELFTRWSYKNRAGELFEIPKPGDYLEVVIICLTESQPRIYDYPV